ncbi:MAG: gamma-glutamyl-gamma-aminobutyrate hydrolase family protein [Alphaproteobacteria bacterium]|jgi:putative glutamine amidotransferase|nr:gamma-glutamyl-gamma-aminobutyrate hydrolase family protein [Candidatus Jidaibacter sp.]
MKPIIAITLDYPQDNAYAKTPWYAIREEYLKSVADSAGTPFLLHYHFDDIDDVLSRVDGLMLTGGAVDIDPAVYGEDIRSNEVSINKKRSQFEMELFKKAVARKIPILAICAGEQLMNVVLGGSLLQHIPDDLEGALEHHFNTDRHLPRHTIKVDERSKLFEIIGKKEYMVNSTHHQAVKSLGSNIIASAHSPDGVIEAIETKDPDHFCLGVQWHPEYFQSEEDKKLMRYFVNECLKYKKKKL